MAIPSPRTDRLPDALAEFDAIAARLEGRTPAVFLDYDGTLTPIVARPDLAVLADDMRTTLRDLAARCPVAVVSGRDRADVEELVKLDGIYYAGSHGFDIAGPDGFREEYAQGAAFLPALDKAEVRLKEALTRIDGALVERKKYAIAVHYRLVPDADVPVVESAVDLTLDTVVGLRKTYGKKVFELRPKLDWDKGRAVLWLLQALKLDRPDVVPFFLGDDDTDEDAFRALSGRGINLLIAETLDRQTAADYRLHDPDEAGRFLRRLAERLGGGG